MRHRDFFRYARERHRIYMRRQSGDPRPWTRDPVLQTSRFTNVFRELDRTTEWFRGHIRDPLSMRHRVLPATVIFRWFNRIETGEALFCQQALGFHGERPGETAFEAYMRTGEVGILRASILQYCGDRGPYVTGAYTINTKCAGDGLSKLDGVLRLIEMWFDTHPNWNGTALRMKYGDLNSLEATCGWLKSPCLGPFMAYEVACDLRHTHLLRGATDVMTWANLGPGAQRGLNRIHGRPVSRAISMGQALEEMRELLLLSQKKLNWNGPPWEMREVEHTLCEFDKYERVRAGEGQTRGAFDGC